MALPQLSIPSRRQSPQSCPPRFRVAQERGAGNFEEEIAAVAELIGYPQLDWQRDVTGVWSTYDEDGQWVHRRNGASVPRQAGKSVDGIVWATFLVALLGYSVLWTDHNYSTTCEMLDRFRSIFGRKVGDTVTVQVNADVSYPATIRAIRPGADDERLPISQY